MNTRNKTVIAKGALLHNRYDSSSRNLTTKSSHLKIFPSNIEKYMRNMEQVVGELKKEHDLSFDPLIIVELNKCIDGMRQILTPWAHLLTLIFRKSGECRSAVIKCRERMDTLANWHFDETPDVFLHWPGLQKNRYSDQKPTPFPFYKMPFYWTQCYFCTQIIEIFQFVLFPWILAFWKKRKKRSDVPFLWRLSFRWLFLRSSSKIFLLSFQNYI